MKLLNDSDKLSVIGISDKVIKIVNNHICLGSENLMFAATMENKQTVYDFIDSLNKSAGATNHTLGFQASFQLLSKVYTHKSERVPISFLYISRGLLSPLSEAKNVLQVIAEGQNLMPHPVVINTCAIIIDKRRVMYEIQFLKDITYQNYSKFNLSSIWSNVNNNLSGKLFIVNKTREYVSNIGVSMFSELYSHKEFLSTNLVLHKPYYDSTSDELIMSISKTCKSRGVFGIDFSLNDILESVMYSNTPGSYKFLTDLFGNTISHPLFPRPNKIKNDFESIPIKYLENKKGFEALWKKIATEERGNATLDYGNNIFSYVWNRISSIMIVCTVTDNSKKIKTTVDPTKVPLSMFDGNYEKNSLNHLVYHRLDLLPPSATTISMCQYFKQTVTYDAISLFLSARSFISPYNHIKNNRLENIDDNSNFNTIQNFMAYLKDGTNLFANPGMLNEIRNNVIALYHVMELLKKKHMESDLKKYVIRRYATTPNGVLQVFPGCLLDPDFEPNTRPWYRRAIDRPGKLAITEYLDAGGAGYIISISYAVFFQHQPIAVISMDLTQGFFYKMLLDTEPACNNANIKCFLMENEGYLIAHPNILSPSLNKHPIEHIAHKESQVANDILNHKKFVRKVACNNYLNGTVQRFYQFNMSTENEIITNWANVEKTKYQITSVKDTNLFVGIINSTSLYAGAFCPCSTIDNLCLNCYRMEQLECECPCECPGNSGECSFTLKNSIQSANESLSMKNTTWQPCLQPIEYVYNYQAPQIKESIDSCELFNCDLFNSQMECIGVLGCSWCQLNYDDTPLNTPYCTLQSICYQGIFGSSRDAYGTIYDSNVVIDPINNYNSYSAIFPVMGVLLILFIVVGFAMYCYKLNNDNNSFGEHLYADSIPDNNCAGMPMNRLDFYDDNLDDHDLGIGGNSLNQSLLQNQVSNAIILPNIASPYRIATNYRRPYGDSSDHGYSTMTPQNDDSEHLANRNKIRRLSMSDSASVNTSVSSPQNNQPFDLAIRDKQISLPPSDQTTIHQTMVSPQLLSPNKFLAEVQVHRHMEMES